MLSRLPERGHDPWRKTHSHRIHQVNGTCTRTENFIEHIIIPRQHGEHLTPESSAALGKIVIMAVLALVTAEFLVCPAVPDLVSALKALWHMPFYVLSVIHRPNFSSNVKTPPLTCNMQTEILLFLRQCFSFFL